MKRFGVQVREQAVSFIRKIHDNTEHVLATARGYGHSFVSSLNSDHDMLVCCEQPGKHLV